MLMTLLVASSSLRNRWSTVWARWHYLVDAASDRYRPERHYMRGPGPKWHAKHRNQNVL